MRVFFEDRVTFVDDDSAGREEFVGQFAHRHRLPHRIRCYTLLGSRLVDGLNVSCYA